MIKKLEQGVFLWPDYSITVNRPGRGECLVFEDREEMKFWARVLNKAISVIDSSKKDG